MKVQIELKYYKGFHWIHSGNISFIGYLLDGKNLIPSEKDVSEIFKNCSDLDTFKDIISKLNGVFSIVLQAGGKVLLGSDPTRFFTLFYTVNDNDGLIISDDAYFIADKLHTGINYNSKIEFLASGFTYGNNTLFESVKQVQSGEVLCFDENGMVGEFYYSFSARPNDIIDHYATGTQNIINQKINRSFNHSLGLLKEYPVLLPLSGGYDSRLIAMKLKELDFKNVVCFTYGRKTKEVDISKRVADNLGFNWYFIEYTDNLIRDFHSDPVFQEYFKYVSRASSMFYLQEYPAIKFLLDQGIITNNYFTIPGHSGDILRGAMISNRFSKAISKNSFSEYLLKKKFYHHPLTVNEKKVLKRTLMDDFARITEKKSLLPYTIPEAWELKERTSKYIFNSAHAFTFFGIKTFFPFADMELLNFFRTLPLKYRTHGNAYYKSLKFDFFKKFNLDFEDDIQPVPKDFAISEIRRKFKPLLPISYKKKLLEKNDWPFYGPMTKLLEAELHAHDIYPKTNYSSYLYRILHWYIIKIDRIKNQKIDE